MRYILSTIQMCYCHYNSYTKKQASRYFIVASAVN